MSDNIIGQFSQAEWQQWDNLIDNLVEDSIDSDPIIFIDMDETFDPEEYTDGYT
jgi:hypothetical protein